MGMMNGHDPLQAALAAAQQQRAQEQMLRDALQSALTTPVKVTHLTAPTLVKVEHRQDGSNVLHVAMINGDRWDIPIGPLESRRLAFSLASNHNDEEQAEGGPSEAAA